MSTESTIRTADEGLQPCDNCETLTWEPDPHKRPLCPTCRTNERWAEMEAENAELRAALRTQAERLAGLEVAAEQAERFCLNLRGFVRPELWVEAEGTAMLLRAALTEPPPSAAPPACCVAARREALADAAKVPDREAARWQGYADQHSDERSRAQAVSYATLCRDISAGIRALGEGRGGAGEGDAG